MFFTRLKRDAVSIYFLLLFFRQYLQKQWASCLNTAAKIELLEANISYPLSALLFSLMQRHYTIGQCSKTDPYVVAFLNRFGNSSGRQFLQNNLIFLKPYISEKEKGILLLKYTEVLNAFPFLFDIGKIQERYHLVLEPSAESPFQPYNKFIGHGSSVFVQSLSEREKSIHRKHGFYPLDLCAGDWVNESVFMPLENTARKYDFCVIANFIKCKRYPYLMAALAKYWKGDLKFAIISSKYVGNDKDWINNLLAKYGLGRNAELFTDLTSDKVNLILNQSGSHLLGSLREGANKATFESMIAGTPAIVYGKHIGFPLTRFSLPLVHTYTSGKGMIRVMKQCASESKNSQKLATAARELTGSKVATAKLNSAIKEQVVKSGESWTTDILRKVNKVQSFYYDTASVEACIDDYHFLKSAAINDNLYDPEAAIAVFRKG